MKVFKWHNSGWLPLTVACLMAIGVIVAYVWAVVRKDVEAFIPFISDAGGNPPQSGIFSIFLFLSSVAGLFTVFIRYYSIKYFAENHKAAKVINFISLFLGFVCIIGIIVVASYPVNSQPKNDATENWNKDVLLPHTIGAFMVFSVGVMYAACQTTCSLLIRSSSNSSRPLLFFGIRAFLVLAAFVSFVVMISFPPKVQDTNPTDEPYSTTSATIKKSSGPDWQSEGISTVVKMAEWVLAFSLFLLFATLFSEMKDVGIELKIAPSSEFTRLNTDSGSRSTISSHGANST